MPRDDAAPAAGRFRLAVVVIRSARQPALPDPVVYISGGPGAPLTMFAAYQARHPYAPDRDLVLLDQRGTGRSEPDLCPDLNDHLLGADLAVASAGTEDALTERRAAFMACRDEVLSQGISLRNFGTTVTAEDYEQVRRALGVARWNVYGESYGTTVAMALTTRFPASVRSLVLDSLYPPDPLPLRSALLARARDAFFAHCAHDPGCASLFPDLARTYREALDRLARAPLPVALPPGTPGTRGPVLLTPSLFELLVGNLVYYPSHYPGLPRLIAAVRDGGTDGVGDALAEVLRAAGQQSISANAAVECRDRPQLRAPFPDGMDPADRMHLFGVCDGWVELGPPPPVPTGTAVPTLVLVGEFDPVAGPELSRKVAMQIGPAAHLVEFPGLGHNVRHFSPCAVGVVAAFIAQPDGMPDTACAGQPAPIRFLPPPPAR